MPRSVQDAIPIRRIFADGIFQVGNQYSKTWSFTDINYAIASKEDKTSMFLDYSELLNALDSGASAKSQFTTAASIRPSSSAASCCPTGMTAWTNTATNSTRC